ncbi:Gfo/Idh/MocA family oxidoreductase [Pseudonocardia petroleophila]|uniref:Gfo/Idh/MocA family oxidoreductase n=1 Tax=Pseudonocardia petroleophila TaxID=37331 RepID=A0A7G7MMN2_9PSEU|nr:Gfo/Idh/MocA family oxidoreductase [Pseudonocardia petroleophila]QNG54043.1 Gfo/Idh/MocA family oxidoreductase [Pseudonocardia petroleophila]
MTDVSALRVGLVGGGPWARRVHGPALVAHPGTELASVWTRRPEVAADLVGELGGRAVGSFEELLADVDAVAFAVPPQVQGELAVRAAAAGKHLICEKPLAADLDGARAVAQAAAGVVSAVVLTLRYDTGIAGWLAGVPAGAGPDTLGAIRWLSGSLLGGPYATSPWRAAHGALLDLGPHVVDLLDAALGPVTGVDWAHLVEPDLWRFALRHDGGAHSTVTVSLRLPVDPSEIELTVFGGVGRHRFSGGAADARTCYGRLLDGFVDAVHGGPPVVLDAARGLRLQEVVDEVARAAG